MAKRTARAKRAARVARSDTATKAQKQAARNVIKAEKAAVALGSDIGALREARTAAMDTRAERFKTGGTQSLADTIAAANQARAYADAMRRISGREKGERTPYTGAGITDVDGVGDIDAQAYRDRFMEPGVTTPWQNVNIQQMLEQEGDDVRAQREAFRTGVWDDTWDPATGKWVRGDRTDAIADQLRRYNEGTAPVPTWSGLLDGGGGGGGGGPGTGGGSGGAYTPMAAQDWSGIMPQGVFAGSEVQPTQAMQGLVADQGLQYQPWAMPDNSVAGSPFVSQNVQYNAPLNYNPVVAAGGGDGTTTNNGGTTTQAWVGPGGETDFNAWSQAQHERMYPGRQAAAMEAGFGGLNYWAPGAADWRASLVDGQIPQAEAQNGLVPAIDFAGRNVG